MDYKTFNKGCLEEAKRLYKTANADQRYVLEKLFPELRETEDEKIRKWIINEIKIKHHNLDEENVDFADKAIAWLEKQEGCEHIRKEWLEHIKQSWYKEGFTDGKYSGGTSKEWTINDTTTLNELIDFLENGTAKLQHDLTRYANWLKIQFTPIEKQGEQKSADSYCQENCKGFQETGKCFADGMCKAKREAESVEKAEPKFKIGDWLINPRTSHIIHIKDVLICYNKGIYELENSSMSIKNVEDNFRLWTIQDAKDGDVLIVGDEDDTGIAICGKNDKLGNNILYCYYDDENGFAMNTPIASECLLHPATKEQSDLLFAKMREAGYEWDAEKKKLKKVDAELTDFEKSLKHIMIETLECGDTHNLKADAEMLLRFAQKPAEWSEEDEKKFSDILAILRGGENCYYNSPTLIDWLKSLKDRYTWKPSDEQMVVLELASKYERVFTPKQIDILIGLKEQLRKLKG